MQAKDLIGHLAIRTKPAKTNYGEDNSHTTEPIRILAVTESHIAYQYTGTMSQFIGDKVYLLNSFWNDNNWTDYEEILRMANNTIEKLAEPVGSGLLQ